MDHPRSSAHTVAAIFSLLVLPFVLGGCAVRVGRSTVARDRFDYSNAIARSWKEQTLLNMVKLRYAEPPVFLDIAQVVATYTFEASAAVGAPNLSEPVAGADVLGRWTESPTITYNPLTGEKFIKSLMQPVPPESLLSLIQAGWPVDGVFAIGVRQINGIRAPTSLAMIRTTGDPEFPRLLSLLKELQVSGNFGLRVEQREAGVSSVFSFRSREPDAELAGKSRELRALLGLDPAAQQFQVSFGGLARSPDEISILTRSMMEILAEAASGVEVPAADLDAGRAVRLPVASAELRAASAFHVHVRCSAQKPDASDAYASVRYRNQWFWIADNDLTSKRGIGFLMVLFMLAESGTPAAPPVLTIQRR